MAEVPGGYLSAPQSSLSCPRFLICQGRAWSGSSEGLGPVPEL